MSHALLSPSAAHRWLHCTAAPTLESGVPDGGSEFAREGSLAHAMAAKRLKAFLGEPTDGEDAEIAELKDYESPMMEEYVEEYVDYVLELFAKAKARTADAVLRVETRVSLSAVDSDLYGTADAIVIADCRMDVVDLKFGKGVEVSAVRNPQMMIYALGAMAEFSWLYDINTVALHIVQPRKDNYSTWETTDMGLMRWRMETLVPAAAEAKGPEPRTQPGDWCRFCKVRPVCKALAESSLKAATSGDPRLMSTAELAKVLPWIPMIKAWAGDAEKLALDKALGGEALPGYKLVEGRSVRTVSDARGLLSALLAEGYAEEEVMRPREARTIGDLEKLVGRKRFAALSAAYVSKPAGKPTLVPESDKRPAMSPKSDFEEFLS